MTKPNKTKGSFIQDWGTYGDETFVCVGLTKKEILQHAKKLELKKDYIAWLSYKLDELDESSTRPYDDAFCLIRDDEPYTFLWMGEYNDNWDYWGLLIHECCHLIHARIMRHRQMWSEDEAIAYQMEYMFQSIRRKIQSWQ